MGSDRDISSSLSLQSRDTQEACGAIIPLTPLGELGADQFTCQQSSTRAAAGVKKSTYFRKPTLSGPEQTEQTQSHLPDQPNILVELGRGQGHDHLLVLFLD